jgi:DNA repair exonuclease SbcCD ATPase subunit
MEDIDTLTNALQQSLNAKLSQLCVDILGRVTQDLSAVSTKAPAIFGAFIMVTLRNPTPETETVIQELTAKFGEWCQCDKKALFNKVQLGIAADKSGLEGVELQNQLNELHKSVSDISNIDRLPGRATLALTFMGSPLGAKLISFIQQRFREADVKIADVWKQARQLKEAAKQALSEAKKNSDQLNELRRRWNAPFHLQAAHAQLEKENGELRSKIAQLQQDHDVKVAQLQEDEAAKVAQLKRDHDAKVAQLQQDQAVKVAQLKQDHDAKVAQLERTVRELQQKEQGSASVTEPWKQDMDDLRRQLGEDMDDLRRQLGDLNILRPLNSVTPGAGVYGCYLHPMSRLTPTPLHCFVGT